MCILLLESVVIDIAERTFTEVIEVVVQDDAVEQEEEQVAYFRLVLVESRYEMCNASLESIAISLWRPLPDSTKTPLHDDADEQDEEQVE